DTWAGDMIKAMFALCRRGLVFNLLSEYYARDNPGAAEPGEYYYAQPEAVHNFCAGLSRQIAIDHSSAAQSFAVYVYRNNAEPMHRLIAELKLGRTYQPEHDAIVEFAHSFGMHDELITYLETLEPCAHVYEHIGLTAFFMDDPDRQLQAFIRAAELAPDSASIQLRLAITYMDRGQHDRAVPVLERAIAVAESGPRAADLHVRMALCHERLGRYEQAVASCRAALEHAPEHQSAHAALRRMQTSHPSDS
ncbi:MAG: tetratricopeptide repeat protein, partial [Myxococcota bacterium]